MAQPKSSRLVTEATLDDQLSTAIAGQSSPVVATASLLLRRYTGGLKLKPELVVAYGDSLTHSDGGIWETECQRLLGVRVIGRGASGERARGIAARQGGVRQVLTVDGGFIPESGSVTVRTGDTFVKPTPYMSKNTMDGILAGIHGTLGAGTTDQDWLFTRSDPGNQVSVPDGAEYIFDDSIRYRDGLEVIWAGRNNFPFDIDGPDGDEAGAAIQAMVDGLAYPDKYVLMTVTNGSNEGAGTAGHTAVVAFTAWLKTNFPGHVLDIRRKLIDEGLSTLGITPTPQDLTDVSNDTVPDSLRKDWIHLKPAAYNLVGRWVADFIAAKQWVDTEHTAPDRIPVVLASDSFNRADTAPGTLGTLDAAYGGATGKTWSPSVQMHIIDDRVGATTLSTFRHAVFDVGADNYRLKITISAGTSYGGLVFRAQSSTGTPDCYRLRVSGEGMVRLESINANSSTTLWSSSTGVAEAGSVLEVSAQGSSIKVEVDGATVYYGTDSTYPTGRLVGLCSAYNTPDYRLDDFYAYDF